MRKILFLLVLVWTYFGASNIYDGMHYRTPPVTTLAATPARSLPTFVTLKDITFDVDHLLKLKYGSEVLYIPVRAKGASPQSEYPVVIQTSAKELIAAVESKSAEALPHLLALARRTEVTGRAIQRLGSDRRIDELRKELPQISADVVLIDEGASSPLVFGIVQLVTGLGIIALTIGGGFKQVAPVQPPPAPAPSTN